MSSKPVPPISTLLLALRSQIRISEIIPVFFDVVVALTMAHYMENGRHYRRNFISMYSCLRRTEKAIVLDALSLALQVYQISSPKEDDTVMPFNLKSKSLYTGTKKSTFSQKAAASGEISSI